MSAQPEPVARETRLVDPRALVTRANVRAVAEPDPELVESIRANGIIQPPVVYADGDELVLVAGHRRTAAAIAAGLERIEVVVGPQLAEGDRLAVQVSENTNRAGLRAVETAAAVQQMTLLGVPAGQIAKAAGLRRAQVEAARAVAAAAQTVKEAIIEAPTLTLDQAAELSGWADDPDAVADLISAAEDGEVAFAHTKARLDDARTRAAELAATVEAWTAKGYQVLNPDGRPITLPAGAVYTADMVDADGVKVGPGSYYGVGPLIERPAAAGRLAVVVSSYQTTSVVEVCLDPKAFGLKKAPSPYAAARPAQDSEQRATVIANNKAWKLASGVRQEHLGRFIRAGKFPPALVDALHRHLLAHLSIDPQWKRTHFYTWLDFPGSGVAKTEDKHGMLTTSIDPGVPANRVTGQLLAAVADHEERALENSTWRGRNESGVAYLALLLEHTGYQLADVEVLAMKATNPTWKAADTAARTSPAKTAGTAKATSGTRRAGGKPLVEVAGITAQAQEPAAGAVKALPAGSEAKGGARTTQPATAAEAGAGAAKKAPAGRGRS